MPKQVVWSSHSKKDLENILFYLIENWDDKVVNKFVDIVDDLVQQISNNPKQFPIIHTNLGVRKCVITKHNTLYYRERRNLIDILRIYDSRQDPKKLRFNF